MCTARSRVRKDCGIGRGRETSARIDAGGTRISRQCASPAPEAIAEALRELSDVSVESIFVAGPDGNANERDMEPWIAQLAELRPARVYVTTIAEPPLAPTVRRTDAATLAQIAEQLNRRTGLIATVLP